MPRPDRLSGPTRRRLRVLAWRSRHPLAALCAGLAALLVVGQVRPPPPPTRTVAVAARDLAVGTVLRAADVALRAVPPDLVPGTGPPPVPDALEGRRLAVAVPAGLVLVPELLVDDAISPPAGTVVVPVRFADAGAAAVLRAGTRVDVVAAPHHEGGPPEQLAHAALVLPAPPSADGGREVDPGAEGPVLLAVTPDEAVLLSGSTPARALAPVIVG